MSNDAVHVLITGGSGFIGEALSRRLLHEGLSFTNFDISAPSAELVPFWQRVSLLDATDLEERLVTISPTHVVHLAAEANARLKVGRKGSLEEAFPTNTLGTRNLVRALNGSKVKRVLAVSTSFVHGPSSAAKADTPPHTDYGRSKYLMEKEIRTFSRPWVISRPAYVWGASRKAGCTTLIEQIERGSYLHPSGRPIVRSYCYVENLCAQFSRLLFSPNVQLLRHYSGCDEVIDSRVFVNRLSLLLRGQKVRTVHPSVLKTLGLMGDLIPKVPLNSFRVFHMTHDFVVDSSFTDSELLGAAMDENERSRDFLKKWRNLA